MQKKRPSLIVSPDELNDSLGTVIVAPITSTERQLPFIPYINEGTVTGKIFLPQLRAVDKSRLINKVATLPKNDLKSVLSILQALFA